MSPAVLAYIGLGSNLGDPVAHLCRALRELRDLDGVELRQHSGLYRNPPMGPPDQPDYVNAVAAVRTALSAEALLDGLQAIEQAHDRRRDGERWGPRSLDLDLLLYGQAVIDTQRLIVPHPGMHERLFVLFPLTEIAPALQIPGRGALADLLPGQSSGMLQRIEPFPCESTAPWA